MQTLQNIFTILIVDDNQNNLFTLRTLIEDEIDAKVLEALSGQVALKIVERSEVDLIILDIQMPEMDGFEVAKYIHSRQKTRHIPIVFLTAAYKSEEFRQKGFSAGAADYLTKPIDTHQLLNRIKTYLNFIGQARVHTHELAETNRQLQAEINERKQAETALVHLSTQNRLILESVHDGICGMDLEGRIRFINPAAAKILGYSQDAVVGCLLNEIICSPENATPDCQCHTILKAVRDKTLLYADDGVFYHKNGIPFPVECKVAPLQEGDQVTGMVMSFNDISVRKQSESSLQQAKDIAEKASMAKSAFLANMSHEFRTPLNAILGYTEILLEELMDFQDEIEQGSPIVADMEWSSDLKKIRGASVHLLGLINSVLDLSKIEAGKMDIYAESFPVAVMLKDVNHSIQPLIDQKENVLEIDCPDSVGYIDSDLTKVRQIMLNLCGNSCKFTEKGVIRVRVRKDIPHNRVTFQISDTGIGMTPAQQQRLFQAFTQADVSTTRKYGGTGLGLTISKRFTEMLGGTITVNSVEGEGTTFTVILPLSIDKEQVVELSKDFAKMAEIKTVLIIDDEPLICEMLQKSIADLGYRAISATSGVEGLRLAREEQPDVITLDIMMPEMDGWTVLKHLRNDPALTAIPVILVSAMEEKRVGYGLGATEYLVKPITAGQLAPVLNKYLQGTRGNMEILVVEDDEIARGVMKELLQSEGWQVTVALNGKQALEQVYKHPPALILLDLLMPEMNGFEFVDRLRQEPAYAAIPIVVLTAMSPETLKKTPLGSEVDSILFKGQYSSTDLLNKVNELLKSVLETETGKA